MKLKSLFVSTIIGLTVLSLPVCAESTQDAAGAEAAATPAPTVFTTADGVLSIEAPSDKWVQTADPNYWFTMSDGKSTITVDHLSNGEELPKVQVADASYAGVFQAFVSTKNEVFVVKALASDTADLQALMQAIGTVKVLKFDTKTAIQKETAQVSEFGLNAFEATYYVTINELNVRAGCSTDDALLGALYYGEEVAVKGAVTRNGENYGWYKISFNGADAYVAADFLSETRPPEKQGEKIQCEFCGEWFEAGNDYRNHVMAAHPGAYSSDGQLQCPHCGKWVYAGDDFKNHLMTDHPQAYAESQSQANYGDQERVQCEYCGEWFDAGNDYRNHVMAAHSGAQSAEEEEPFPCQYCGELCYPGDDYRNHLIASHPDIYAAESIYADQENADAQ